MGKVHMHSHDDYEGGEIFLGHVPICWTGGDVDTSRSWEFVTCKRCLRQKPKPAKERER